MFTIMKNFLLIAIFSLFTISAYADITFGGSAVDDGQIVFGDVPQTLTVTLSGGNAFAAAEFDLFTNLSPTVPIYSKLTTSVAGGLFKTVTFTVSTIGNGGDVGLDGATGQFFLVFNNATGTALEGVAANSILPIELKSFEAKNNENNVNLVWTTSMEENNDFFTLERSFDGKEFVEVSKINGAGDSAEDVTYTFSDDNVTRIASSNTAYYRLKQTDFDGAFAYSDIISVNLENRNDLEVTNVAVLGNELSVNFVAPTEGNTEINVYDLTGRMIATNNQVATEGYNTTKLTLNTNQSGIFIVRITNGQTQTVRKIFK
jgi:hypothetical protein